MTEPEKYTLDRVLEIVRGHAELLRAAGAALEVSEGKDPVILAVVGDKARKASEDLWDIDAAVGFTPGDRCEDLFDAWYSDEGGAVGRARNVLPLLVLAVEAGAKDPDRMLSGLERWRWCHEQTESIAEGLIEWVRAHEKDAAPATATKENGVGAGPVSQPEEPLDAVDIHYRVQEALRPLRIMADSEILMHGRYRNGENDGESDRAEDLARLAKQAYEALRAFEDSGHECGLRAARDLLWWGQSVCVALNVMALRLGEDMGSAAPDGIRIDERHAVHAALDILSKDSFERVRADGGDIEKAQAEKVREASS